jgi:AcrR family transcriptional regulator
VLRTRAAIEAAFVELVLEHGYDAVSVEDIADRADLAKATFYRHYENKEAVMSAVFFRIVDDGADPIIHREGPWSEVRGVAIQRAYQNASKLRDLYKVCLSDVRTRVGYRDTITRYAEEDFERRLKALDRQPRVPVRVMAKAFSGAHLAILESWLDGEIGGTAEEVAAVELDLLVAGFAWAHNVSPFDIGYTIDPRPPSEANPSPNRDGAGTTRTRTPTTTKKGPSKSR